MAVFTEVSTEQVRALLCQLSCGELLALRGIEGGIENTNYFVSTDRSEYVLTLFERLTAQQLPFYLHLMQHLAHAGIPVPEPQADSQGRLLHTVAGKPAALATRLRGQSQLTPQPLHCAAVGDMLARMHLAGRSYPRQQPHLRGLAWWNQTVPLVLPHIDTAQAALLQDELAWQNRMAVSSDWAALPRGVIHADVFCDNVLFDGETLTGVFDFYFAGVDCFLFDVAVCLNDWCIDVTNGCHVDDDRARALLAAYTAVRPFTAPEKVLLPTMARAAALRFWISRLWDFYLPRQASLLKPHDPRHFERVLRQRVAQPLLWD